MNILFIATFPIIPSEGGVQRVTDTLAKELGNRGHNVVFLCHDRKGKLDYNGFTCPQYYVELQNRSDKEICSDVETIIHSNKIEFVIIQTPTVDTVRLCSFLPSSTKIISVCHVQPFTTDSITWNRILKIRVLNFRQFVFKYLCLVVPCLYRAFFANVFTKEMLLSFDISDKVCFISERFYPRLLKHIPHLPQNKLMAIYNPNTFCVDSITVNKNKEKLILWVGRIENASKNCLDFIKAWSLFSHDHPDWNAAIIGEGGDLEYNKNYICTHNIHNIEFTGQIEDVSTWYDRAMIIAVTSWGESWCMAITEGMSYGCIPCVYDTYETLHDIVDNGQNGFIVSPNYKSMAFCLDQISYHEDLFKIALAAHEKVKKFSVQNIVQIWEMELKKI